MSKHTPGPWKVEHGGVNSFDVWLEGWKVPKLTENEANAQLIAAAPDMLEALEMARDARSPGEKICASAMRGRAIAKAEGKHG